MLLVVVKIVVVVVAAAAVGVGAGPVGVGPVVGDSAADDVAVAADVVADADFV